MKTNSPTTFHKLYRKSKPRVVYYKKDFLDYLLMLFLSAIVIASSYGSSHVMSIVGFVLSAFMLAMFIIRHGIEFRVPVILRRPQEVLYTIAYKLQNLTPIYVIALGLWLLENYLIVVTPNLPHHVDLMRKIALYLFYIHFLSITLYRTVILIDHCAKKELIREVLMQTPWKRVVKKHTNITLEIAHAYGTGVLTHIITIAPWYLVIVYSRFSVIFLPVVALINIVVHQRWYKVFNAWFYRDHWLGHNSEFDFIFLHGTHHDAIPSGMIAVAENGFLEGFLRFTIGSPAASYNPVISFLVYTLEVTGDIKAHQYIPGIFPRIPRREIEFLHHSTHHYGPLEPYSIGFGIKAKMDQVDVPSDEKVGWIPHEVKNSIQLDEELTGFQVDNPTHLRILSLYDKYQN